MIKPAKVRIAVLPAFHAFAGGAPAGASLPSWLDLFADQHAKTVNPFAGLVDLIQSDGGPRADVVLCCGDLGDKASPQGQQYVWREVNRVKDELGARCVLGACGNHDMDSRHAYDDFDAKGQIQALAPPFPIDDERRWLEYWAKNWTVTELDGVRFVLLNTAAYHGYAKAPQEPEYAHGRVSDRTIDGLVAELKAKGPGVANVLVCHHHPFKNDKVAVSDQSEMRNGDRLINSIVDAQVGPWLVVHGHKHDGRVFYAPGTNASPTVFSAASFSARPYPNQVTPSVNEFYVLELEVPPSPGLVTSLRGRIRTWTWSYGTGWRRPGAKEGLGPMAGFGKRADTGELAVAVAEGLRAGHAGGIVKWQEVLALFPDLGHLIPEDLDHLVALLRHPHGFGFSNDMHTGEIALVEVP